MRTLLFFFISLAVLPVFVINLAILIPLMILKLTSEILDIITSQMLKVIEPESIKSLRDFK